MSKNTQIWVLIFSSRIPSHIFLLFTWICMIQIFMDVHYASLCYCRVGFSVYGVSTIFQLNRGNQFYWWWKPEYYPEKNNRPVASHWQTVSHNVVSSTCTRGHELNVVLPHNSSGDRHWLHRFVAKRFII